MTIQADPPAPADQNVTPAPAAETPATTEPKTNFVVPGNRSAVIDALAARRAQLREEIDPVYLDDLTPATPEAAIEGLRRAAGDISELDNRDDTVDEPVSDATQDDNQEREPEQPEAPKAPAAAPAAPPQPAGPKMTEVIIDGRRVMVAEDVVARAVAQSTNERLARLESAAPRQPSAPAAGEPAPAAAPTEPAGDQGNGAADEPISDTELASIRQSIQFGGDAEADQALRDLMTRTMTAAQRKAVEAIRQDIEARDAQKKRTEDLEKSVTKLQEKFPEIMGDSDYRMLAIEKVFHRRATELVNLGYDQAVVQNALLTPDGRARIIATADQEAARGRLKHRDEVFTDVVGEVHRKVFGNAPPTTQRQGQRQTTRSPKEAKRQLTTLPPTASARAPIVPDEPPRAQTPSQIVQNMRKQRGQAI